MKIGQRLVEGLIYGACLIAIRNAPSLHIVGDLAVTALGLLGIFSTTVFKVVDSSTSEPPQ